MNIYKIFAVNLYWETWNELNSHLFIFLNYMHKLWILDNAIIAYSLLWGFFVKTIYEMSTKAFIGIMIIKKRILWFRFYRMNVDFFFMESRANFDWQTIWKKLIMINFLSSIPSVFLFQWTVRHRTDRNRMKNGLTTSTKMKKCA